MDNFIISIENAVPAMAALKEKFRSVVLFEERGNKITAGNMVARRNVDGRHDAPDGWQFYTKEGEWRGFIRDSSPLAAIDEMAFQQARDEMILGVHFALRDADSKKKSTNFGLNV